MESCMKVEYNDRDINYLIGILATDGYTKKVKNYFSVLEVKDEQIIDDICNKFKVKKIKKRKNY